MIIFQFLRWYRIDKSIFYLYIEENDYQYIEKMISLNDTMHGISSSSNDEIL